jgi:CRP/FNR family transcriptional regulator, cyclic AMP receptor protein
MAGCVDASPVLLALADSLVDCLARPDINVACSRACGLRPVGAVFCALSLNSRDSFYFREFPVPSSGILDAVPNPPSVEDVRAIAYFRSLDDEAAARFAEQLVLTTHPAREVIILEGEPAHGFYYLRSGKARIFRTGPDGREQSFRIVSAGDTFGEVPVFDQRPNPATVESLEASEVILVPTGAVIDIVSRHPEVAVPLLVHFARRLRSFTELVEQISLQTVPARIARYLYQIAREEGIETAEGIQVPRTITQQDLASLVGSVREVVTRALKVFEDDGIVVVRRREIIIRDMDALRAMG